MRIAIYSGSFNPIHIGHTRLAAYIAGSTECGVDEVWMMVTPRNPLKPDASMAPDADRLAMCRIACRNLRGVEASDFEMHLPAPWYSIRTLQALRDKYPHHSFRLVAGSDNWLLFDKWKDPEKIINEFGLIIYPRPGYEIENPDSLPHNVRYLPDAPQTELSSTLVRHFIAGGHPVGYYLDSEVADYISSHHLYQK